MYSFGGEKYEDRKGSRNKNISRAEGMPQMPGVKALVTSISSIKTKARTDFSLYSEIPQRGRWRILTTPVLSRFSRWIKADIMT